MTTPATPQPPPPRKDAPGFDDWMWRFAKQVTAPADSGTAPTDHATLANLNSANYSHLSATNATDLTDGGTSSLHYHAADRDRANHTGTQPSSTISDLSSAIQAITGTHSSLFNLAWTASGHTGTALTIPGFAATTGAAEELTRSGTGTVVAMAAGPTFTTPALGVATATSLNKLTLTQPANGATLTLADGKTITCSNTFTLTATDGSTLAIGTGGTLGTAAYTAATDYEASGTTATHAALTTGVHGVGAGTVAKTADITAAAVGNGTAQWNANKLQGVTFPEIVSGDDNKYPKYNHATTAFVMTAIAGGGDVIGPATNTDGYLPLWNGANSKTLLDGVSVPAGGLAGLTALALKADLSGPTFTAPTLGAATATSINKVALTAPATASTLTIADGKTLTASNTLALTATDGSTLAIGTGGTLGTAAYTASGAYDVAGAAAAVTPTTLGLVIGTNVQAYNANLTAINQALTSTSSPTFSAVAAGNAVFTGTQNAFGSVFSGALLNINTAFTGTGNATAFRAVPVLTPAEAGQVFGFNVSITAGSGAENISSATAFSTAIIKGNSGTLGAAQGFWYTGGSVGCTTHYGLRINALSGGSDNNYGVYISAPTGTGAVGLYNGGTSYCVGDVGIGTTPSGTSFLDLTAGTTAKSSLRMPHGVAPTAPVDGDIWTTTTALYARINGTTVAAGGAATLPALVPVKLSATVNTTLDAGYGAYIPGTYEIADSIVLELADSSLMEIG